MPNDRRLKEKKETPIEIEKDNEIKSFAKRIKFCVRFLLLLRLFQRLCLFDPRAYVFSLKYSFLELLFFFRPKIRASTKNQKFIFFLAVIFVQTFCVAKRPASCDFFRFRCVRGSALCGLEV